MFFSKEPGLPFIIAGPCSAETREQILETAAALSKMPVRLFRAGVWKPRTRPGSFEGNGIAALQWLAEVKQGYGIPVTAEVAEPEHVALALKYGVDVLWIGARTTVNPFQVQHIADALRGVQIPVMVKNPVNPDVNLWLGAIERLEQAGVKEVAAIHRGFSSGEDSSLFRNTPHWTIPIELRRRRRDLFLICDPSHITGRRDKVADMSQRALDLHFDGLMIETHPRPEEAWSDAAQQLTPVALQGLIERLVMRQQQSGDMGKDAELEFLRQVMDSIDAEIIELIARRMDLSAKLGNVKKESNMTAYQPDRWREIVETRSAQARKFDLSEEFILSLYERIHHESIRRQLEILQDAAEKLNS